MMILAGHKHPPSRKKFILQPMLNNGIEILKG
jgi:hypothetical protein